MELKDLTEKTLRLFDISSPEEMGSALEASLGDEKKLKEFSDMVDGNLEKDWLQMIYQYYLADREEKKQDYTPSSIAELMGALAGGSDVVVDMCAGSGALIIQRWARKKHTRFIAYEIDENVVPFLLFNMVVRNIDCTVYQADVLGDRDPVRAWRVERGDEFGKVISIKSAV